MLTVMVRKELRETLGLAGLALLAYLYIVTAEIGIALLPWIYAGRETIPFVAESFLRNFCFVSAPLAIGLGLRQSAAESLRGTWLFLLHRPVERAMLIGMKLAVGTAVCLVSAAVPMAAGLSEPGHEDDRGLLQTYGRGFPFAWPALLAVMLVAALLAGLCHRRQNRYAQPWTTVWAIFVFLCGVPGFIGYRLHRRWPVLAPCPACSAAVPRDRDRCAHCQAEFPAPAPQGTEIFAA